MTPVMLPTPSTAHLSFRNIYEPAEDSFFMLDVLSSASETSFLRRRFSPPSDPAGHVDVNSHINPGRSPTHNASPTPLVLEVGTGSGVVLAYIAANASAILGRPDVLCLGGDVNEHACAGAARTVQRNLVPADRAGDDATDRRPDAGIFLDCIQADLSLSVRHGAVDVFVFNPPYVPSEAVPDVWHAAGDRPASFESASRFSALATDGGEDGMEVTWRALRQLPVCLSPRGVAYVLFCKRNRVDEVMEEVRQWEGHCRWEADIVGDSGHKAGWERLSIVRIHRAGVL